ncbi:hypothetical protein [Streptomyces sp. ALI-76-A]|nr:hypothetical protein [Streptomyces sp. ALI-76-A]MDL5206046.1 hypothetical protein [Streptomyces sp. ALI-76-A]
MSATTSGWVRTAAAVVCVKTVRVVGVTIQEVALSGDETDPSARRLS